MLRVKGWNKFQHYKDRRPPWIKLSRELLENYDWFRLKDASKALAVTIWLLAAEHDDPKSGLVSDDPEWLGFRARMEPKIVIESVKDLVKYGFLEHLETDASDLLSPCYQAATPETETETEDIYKGGSKKKDIITLEELSVHHIKDWLAEKRVAGRYTMIDEHALLEMFKNYCYANGRDKGKKAYKNFLKAFQNAFDWEKAPRKGKNNDTAGKSHAQRADEAMQRAVQSEEAQSENNRVADTSEFRCVPDLRETT